MFKNPARKQRKTKKPKKNKKVEITVDINKQGGNDLPGDKRMKLAQSLGKSIFIIEEQTIKSEILKQPIKFRSYRECPIKKAAIHTGPGGAKGVMLNEGINDEMFVSGKNAKFAGEEGSTSSKNNSDQQGGEKILLIALDEKSAKKHAVDFNILSRETVRGMIISLQKSERLINEVIDADANVIIE